MTKLTINKIQEKIGHLALGMLVILTAGFLVGCQEEIDVDLPEYENKLVVEGTIETGQPAMVILSKSVSYYEHVDLDYLLNKVFIRDAEVSITTEDGQSERLTFQYCADSPVYFAYCGNQIRGKENTSYTLTIKYNDQTYTATTTIPRTFDLDSIWFSNMAEFLNADTMRTLRILMHDDPSEANFYAFKLKVSCPKFKDRLWNSTVPLAFDDKTFNGLTFNYELERYNVASMFMFDLTEEERQAQSRLTFRPGDTVYVKHSQMDYHSYQFMITGGLEATLGANPFLNPAPVISNIQGENVLGCWCGLASKIDTVVWPDTVGYLNGTYGTKRLVRR